MNNIFLIPFAILNTIIGWTELEYFDIGKAWVAESFLEYGCHMIHIIRESPCDKWWITSREDSEWINWRCIDTSRWSIHPSTRDSHRTRLSSRETKCRIDMVYEEDIPIMSDGMNQVIDSLTEGGSITSMGYDRHLRMSNFYASRQRENSPMKPMNCGQSDLIRFISWTTDIIGDNSLRGVSTFEGKCLEESFLNSIVSTIVTPGHWLVCFLKRNIDICIFFKRVKHAVIIRQKTKSKE